MSKLKEAFYIACVVVGTLLVIAACWGYFVWPVTP